MSSGVSADAGQGYLLSEDTVRPPFGVTETPTVLMNAGAGKAGRRGRHRGRYQGKSGHGECWKGGEKRLGVAIAAQHIIMPQMGVEFKGVAPALSPSPVRL